MNISLPPVELLRECFDYSPELGQLHWKHRPRHHFISDHEWSRWNTRHAGTVAGMTDARSVRVRINNVRYRAHRIIFKLITGDDPKATIDHESGNPFDNRQGNLRSATMKEQSWNRKRVKTNTSGYRGVYWHKKDKKWHSQIVNNGVRRHLGQFTTAAEASVVYETEAYKTRGEFYRKQIL